MSQAVYTTNRQPNTGLATSSGVTKAKLKMRLKRILLKKLRMFCEHSTLHGASYLTRGRGTCIAWGAIMAAGVALWSLLSHMIWQKYSIDPTVTVVESTYYRSEQIPFPAVMICDPLPVYGPNAKNVSHILSSRGYKESEIDEFYDSFSVIQETTYVPPSHIRKIHRLLEDLGLTMEVLLHMFRKPCDVTLKMCRWRSKEYNCSDMFREVVTVVGHCCLFDIAYFKKYAPSNTTLVSGSRPQQALEVKVDGVKAYPNGTVRDGPVLLYMMDAGNEVTLMDSSIALASSSLFDIELEIFAIDSSPEVKALSLATRKCVLPTDQGVGGSFYQKCIATLIMRKVVNYCRCLPHMYMAEYLAVKEYPNCTWERYTCIYSQIEINFADMHSLIRMHDCYQFCDYVEYDPRIDYIRKRGSISSYNSYTRVVVHYASTTCIKYRREVIYTWDQMLANLGGVFGLCLGGSIISIIEIVCFLIDVLVTYLKSFTQAKPKGKKVAFVIEKENIKQDKQDTCFKFVN